jgi:hypothetical protein
MCTKKDGDSGKVVVVMMAISDSGAYAEPLVNELFVQIVCGNAPITIFANALRIRNIYDVQTAISWIK